MWSWGEENQLSRATVQKLLAHHISTKEKVADLSSEDLSGLGLTDQETKRLNSAVNRLRDELMYAGY